MARRCPFSLLVLFALATLFYFQVVPVPVEAGLFPGRWFPKWQASKNPRFKYTSEELAARFGRKPSLVMEATKIREPPAMPKSVSRLYDAREKLTKCRHKAMEQPPPPTDVVCRCWVFAALDAFSDRICQKFGFPVFLLVKGLSECCTSKCGEGRMWNYFLQNAQIVDRCDSDVYQKNCTFLNCTRSTTQCDKVCQQWNRYRQLQPIVYRVDQNQRAIMAEIYTNGPVDSRFTVYEDFYYYESGVYNYTDGDKIGSLPVKIIGWNTSEDGLDYWIVTTPLGGGWGNNGVINVLRGSKASGIEDNITAAVLPDLSLASPGSSVSSLANPGSYVFWGQKFILISIFVWAIMCT